MKSLETRVRKLEERTPQLNGEPVRFIHLAPFEGDDESTSESGWIADGRGCSYESSPGESLSDFTDRIKAEDPTDRIYMVVGKDSVGGGDEFKAES